MMAGIHISQKIANVSQAIAFLAAGTWAITNSYFSVSEQNMTINEGVVVEKLRGKDSSERLDVKLTSTSKNDGQEPGFIIYKRIVFFGHKIGPSSVNLPSVNYDSDRDNFLFDIKGFDWTKSAELLSVAHFASQYELDPAEAQKWEVLLPVGATKAFDLITYQMVTVAAPSCRGWLFWETCHGYRSVVVEGSDQPCKGYLDDDVCYTYFMTDQSDAIDDKVDWRGVSRKDMKEVYGMIEYSQQGVVPL